MQGWGGMECTQGWGGASEARPICAFNDQINCEKIENCEQPANRTVNKTVNRTVNRAVNKTVNKTVNRTVNRTVNGTVIRTVNRRWVNLCPRAFYLTICTLMSILMADFHFYKSLLVSWISWWPLCYIQVNFARFLPTFVDYRLLLSMEILKGLKLHLKPETWCWR